VLAALLRYPERVRGHRVGAVLTGGNVDLDDLPW
jgi:threonine dehydratase